MNLAHFYEFWCFSLGKQARFALNFCSGMPLRKVHELTFLWFGLPGPLRSEKYHNSRQFSRKIPLQKKKERRIRRRACAGGVQGPQKVRKFRTLKKAVVVLEEKIQEHSPRWGRFSSSHFPRRDCPNPSNPYNPSKKNPTKPQNPTKFPNPNFYRVFFDSWGLMGESQEGPTRISNGNFVGDLGGPQDS